jgi:hypothetical protein
MHPVGKLKGADSGGTTVCQRSLQVNIFHQYHHIRKASELMCQQALFMCGDLFATAAHIPTNPIPHSTVKVASEL